MMDPLHLLVLLLCVASCVGEREAVGGLAAPKQRALPVVLDRCTETVAAPAFRGRGGPAADPALGPEVLCGIECQSGLPPPDRAEQERVLGYETVHENGTRTRTRVSLRGFDGARRAAEHPAAPRRRKRQVFGPDGRFVISDTRFVTRYPFSAAARLSTGCSGVLVSPRHVLTAAHCVHDGTDYLEGVPKLRVGLLQLKTKKGKGRGGGRRRGGGGGRGGGRGEAEAAGETGDEEPSEEEDEEHNSVDPAEPGAGGRGGRGRHSRRRGRRGRAEAPGAETGRAGGGAAGDDEGGDTRGQRRRRVPRSAGPAERPVFRWSRVKRTHVPAGWIQTAAPDDNNNNNINNNQSVSADYDYALLELKRPVKQRPMALGVAPHDAPLGRVHFSGYDVEGGPPADGSQRVVYRFCAVARESDDLIYQHCDAQRGATGAGVYVRARQRADGGAGKGAWRRKVIGVFTGHRWVELEGSRRLADFNVAVRITPAKYAQICHWIHADPARCQAA